jgi:hypothetical protein
MVYVNRVPEKFKIPSIYFPPPIVVDGNDTVSTFRKTYLLQVKVFHVNSQEAVEKAEEIADTIRAGRHLIPILNRDGRITDDYIRIRRAEVRQIGDDVALFSLTWDSRYKYDRTVYDKMMKLYLTEVVK